MVENLANKQTRLDFANIDFVRQLFGERNSNLQKIAKATDVDINARGNTVFISGDEIAAALAGNVLNQLYNLLKEGYPIHPNDIDFAVNILSGDDTINLKEILYFRMQIFKKLRNSSEKLRLLFKTVKIF